MTTIVVVVIDIYLYDYYYLTDYSELPYGPFRFARFPFRALGYGPVCPRRRAVPVPAPFVPFPGAPELFLAIRSLEGPRLPASPVRRPFGRRLGKCNGPADGGR